MPQVEALRDEIDELGLEHDVQFVYVANMSEESVLQSAGFGEPTVEQLGLTDIPLLFGDSGLEGDWDLHGTVRERSHVWDPCNESRWHYEHLYMAFWEDNPKAARIELKNAIELIASDCEQGVQPTVTEVFDADPAQMIDSYDTFGAAIGDLDGDGDLDIFGVRYEYENLVWMNDGNGVFNNSGQKLGYLPSEDVQLGDLDEDGDLDAFVANSGPNMVWLNQGDGEFVYGQALNDSHYGQACELGDFDGDGDLDALVVNFSGFSNFDPADNVWLNLTLD